MVSARPSGRGFPAAIVALVLIGLLSFRSALLVPDAPSVAVVDRAPTLLAGIFPFAQVPAADRGPVVVRPAPGRVTSSFHEARRGHAHQGVDIDGETGDPVRAASAGTVVVAGPTPRGFSGYGTIVVIVHTVGVTTLYAHLSRIAVKPGEAVEAGDLVGLMGCTGSCSGSHLHFEVRFGDVPIDPERYLPSG
jgi:murein DD-endopeptidase MepM/ murein hydrolase activator NlpD